MQPLAGCNRSRSNLSPDSPAFWPASLPSQPATEIQGEDCSQHSVNQLHTTAGSSSASLPAPQGPVSSGGPSLTYRQALPASSVAQAAVIWVPVPLMQQPRVLNMPQPLSQPLSIPALPVSCSTGPPSSCASQCSGLQSSSWHTSLQHPAVPLCSQTQAPPHTTSKNLQITTSSNPDQQSAPHSGRASSTISLDEHADSEPESTTEEERMEVSSASDSQLLESKPTYGTGWDSMTEPIMRMIVQRLDSRSQQLCRLVSKHWNFFVISNIEALQPKRAKVHIIRERYVSLKDIDLSACENVRNRNIAILAASQLKLKSIMIGHIATMAYGKPRITNSALVNLSKISTLTSLSFSDCSAITNNSMQVLSMLTNLEMLAFVRCCRISEKGLELICSLPKLHSLTVFSCNKVTEGLSEILLGNSGLQSLHLGHIRLQAERLDGLSNLRRLQELTLHGEEMSTLSLSAIAGLTHLKALGMSTYFQLASFSSIIVLTALTGLLRLNLQAFGDMSDVHLMIISERVRQLEQLKIVVGASVTGNGIEHLAALKHLKAISFESTHASPPALKGIMKLLGLRIAEFPGTSMPHQLLDALARLPRLENLSLSNHEPQNMSRTEHVVMLDDLKFLTRCCKLRRLDLSNTVLQFYMASDLLARFMALRDSFGRPYLQELCLNGCPIDAMHIQLLNTLYPLVRTHQGQRRSLPSSTWVWGECD